MQDLGVWCLGRAVLLAFSFSLWPHVASMVLIQRYGVGRQLSGVYFPEIPSDLFSYQGIGSGPTSETLIQLH